MFSQNEKPLTITELASRIGVSVATVSSVLNNRQKQRRISPETVRKVQQAATEAGYFPNVSARRLRSGYNRCLVLAVITSHQAPLPLVSTSVATLHRLVGQERYRNIQCTITVEMFDAGKLCDLPGLLDGSRFNGAIIANTVAQDDAFLAQNRLSIPVVLIGRDIPNYSSVRDQPEKTGQQAAEILLAAQSSHLAILHPTLLTQTTQGRLDGFCKAVTSHGDTEPHRIVSEGFDERDGYQAMRRFLAGRPKTDALYSVLDSLAVGAYHAIKQAGLRIPHDVAVIGTGDYPMAAYLDPPLSTFSRLQYNLHEESGQLLLGHLTGEIKTPTHILVPVSPVLRESTRRGQWADDEGDGLPDGYSNLPGLATESAKVKSRKRPKR
jgi:LacI family transcriptional regulator